LMASRVKSMRPRLCPGRRRRQHTRSYALLCGWSRKLIWFFFFFFDRLISSACLSFFPATALAGVTTLWGTFSLPTTLSADCVERDEQARCRQEEQTLIGGWSVVGRDAAERTKRTRFCLEYVVTRVGTSGIREWSGEGGDCMVSFQKTTGGVVFESKSEEKINKNKVAPLFFSITYSVKTEMAVQ